MTDFVQAKEFPCPVRVYKCYVSPTWIVLERGTRAFAPSTNEMTHMKMSYARSHTPSLPILRGPRGKALSSISGQVRQLRPHVLSTNCNYKFWRNT